MNFIKRIFKKKTKYWIVFDKGRSPMYPNQRIVICDIKQVLRSDREQICVKVLIDATASKVERK